jgi:hypothetical protein
MEPSSQNAASPYAPLDRYLSLAEADLMSGMLRASGLEPRVRDEYAAGLIWHYIPALGGVRLEVPAEQLEDAQELMASDLEPIEHTEEERAYLQGARRRRRILGVIALFLTTGPLIGLAGLALALNGGSGSKDESNS